MLPENWSCKICGGRGCDLIPDNSLTHDEAWIERSMTPIFDGHQNDIFSSNMKYLYAYRNTTRGRVVPYADDMTLLGIADARGDLENE